MVTKTNKYNPIASTTGSSRYNPVSSVSEIEPVTAFNTTTPYQKLPAQPLTELPKSYPTPTPTLPKSYPQGVMENGKLAIKTVTPDYSGTISAPKETFLDKAKNLGSEIIDMFKPDPNAPAQPGLFGIPRPNRLKDVSGADIAVKILNNKDVAPVTHTVAERTNLTSIVSMVQAIGPKTYQEAYDANRAAQAGDPSKFNQFLYQLGDSVPQTAIGVALSFIPYAGIPLALSYWTALSADEQQQNKGKIESINPVLIDVALDSILGKSIQALFKTPAKNLAKVLAQNFAVEGGTEVSQDLLKYQDAWLRAKTPAEKKVIEDEVKKYFTSGQILMTLGVGGVTGMVVGGGAYALNKNVSQGRVNPILNEQQIGGTPPPEGPAGPAGPSAPVAQQEQYFTIQDIKGKTPVEVYDLIIDRFNLPSPEQIRSMSTEELTALQQKISSLPSMPFRDSGISLVGAVIKGDTGSVASKIDLNVSRIVNYTAELVDRALNKTTVSKEADTTQGPGYRRLSQRLDIMVQNQTLHPEDAAIVKSLFENTSDEFLYKLDVADTARLKTVPAYFNRGKNTIRMRRGMTKEGVYDVAPAEPGKRILHEFGHAGWYLILTEQEKSIVRNVYSELGKTGARRIFEGGISGDVRGSAKYYAKNEQEFFAESFSSYVLENKVPAEQMKPLLQRVAGKFFDAVKRLVSRGDVPAVQRMAPLFEKILRGDRSTPLSEFMGNEPPSFKKDLQEMFNNFEKPVRPNANGIFVDPDRQPVKLPPPNVSKQVPPASIFPSGTVKQGVIDPQQVDYLVETPLEELQKIYNTSNQGLPPDDVSMMDPPEKVLEGEGRTPVENTVDWVDYVTTPWRVLERLGLRENYNQLKKAYVEMGRESKEIRTKLKTWINSVPKESSETIFRSLDGENIQLTPEETRVKNEIKVWLSQWADRMGMKPDERISEYITHIFPLKSGAAIPEEIALLIRNKQAGSVYNPFLLQRKGAEGYVKNVWMALEAYAKRANRKVHMDPALASLKEEAAKKLSEVSQVRFVEQYAARINMRPTYLDTLSDNFIKKRIGGRLGGRPTRVITNVTRRTIAKAKIAMSAVSFAKNLTQGVNTFKELGTKYTMMGYIDLVKHGKSELEYEGVLSDPQLEDQTYSAIKKWAEINDKVLFVNMNASELINRGAAYYGAKRKFLAGKTTAKEYRQAFGRPMPESYKPTMEDAKEYGKFVAEKTQFVFGSLDTPLALSSDLSRTAAQFQTYPMKQIEFVLSAVGDREWAKLIRYLISSTLLFAFVGGAFGMKWSDAFPFVKFGYPPALQFVFDLWDFGAMGQDKYKNKLDTGERFGAVGKSLFTNLVPMGASLWRGGEGLKAVSQGHSDSPSGKFEYRIDQTPMNYARGALFGKGNLEQGRAYYDKKTKKTPSGAGSSSSRYNPI